MAPAGTSLTTHDAARMMTSSPIATPPGMVTREPNHTRSYRPLERNEFPLVFIRCRAQLRSGPWPTGDRITGLRSIGVSQISVDDALDQWRAEYAEPLRIARSHVKSGHGPKNGNSITEKRRKEMLRYKIECVHCGMLLNNGNHNTEHILDKSLGGDNTAQNKMLMCNACNSWRNELKNDWVGKSPTAKDWVQVERYVLWNFITVDYGHRAGRHIPDVHQRFLTLRHPSGRDFEFPGKRWFSRSSDAAPKDTSMLAPIPQKRQQTSALRQSKERLWSRAKRWLSGSEHDHSRRIDAGPNTGVVDGLPKKPIQARDGTAISASSDPLLTDRNPSLRAHVEPFLPNPGETKLLTVISNEIKAADAQGRAIKAIGVEVGFPKSWTVTRMLEAAFGPMVRIQQHDGTTTLTVVQPSNSDSVQTNNIEVSLEAVQSKSPIDEELRKNLLQLLPPTGRIKQAELGNLVKRNDPEERSLREFATANAFPKSRPLYEFLGMLFGDAAASSSEGTVYYWTRAEGADHATASSNAEREEEE